MQKGTQADANDWASRLERGEIVHFSDCPFPVPTGDDLAFLLRQRLASRAHKNIGYDPRGGKISGYARQGSDQVEQLRRVLSEFARGVTAWAGHHLPRYAAGWQLDRVSYRPEEEATRKLRLTARNDLLHVDAFPSRPTDGWRILRVFVNVNPTEPRVWITAEPFVCLLQRYGAAVGLPDGRRPRLFRRLREHVLTLLRPGRRRRSAYDEFMLRLHNHMKADAEFQKDCAKRRWEFQPGSAWMVITDTASHAVLRGRYALEHSYFLAPHTLALPEESPAALLARASGVAVLNRAA